MSDRIGGWSVTASADNATATVTRAADTNKQQVVYGVSASFLATPTAPCLLQILNGITVVWEGYVSAPVIIDFPAGIAMTPGGACSAVLAASGTAGRLGKVNLHGASR